MSESQDKRSAIKFSPNKYR